MNALNLDLAPPNARVLVAVSGGRDSMGLLERLHKTSGWMLSVVHVDHGMRPDSCEDAFFVAMEAQARGLPFHLLKTSRALRGETQARDERYCQLSTCAQDTGHPYVAVAHHRKDQLETRLFNILRGTSPAGLGGMQASRALSPGVTLIRPALEVDPTYLHEACPNWREDPTNTSGKSPRHIIRGKVLPVLEGLMPLDPAVALERLARLAAEDEELLTTLVPQAQVLSHEAFLALHPSLQRRWLRGVLPLDAAQVEAAVECVKAGHAVDAGGGLTLNAAGGIVSRRVHPAVK